MRKLMKLGVCGLAAMMLISGCSKKNDQKNATPSTGTEAGTEAGTANFGTITLGTYKGVEVTKINVEITDEEVDAQIQSILASNPDTQEITDRPAETGDIVNIDYVGKKDGTAFEGGTAQGYDLKLGSNSFIEGFEEGLIGVNVGDKLDLNLTFPAEYQSEELAGAAVVFEVTVNSIKVEKEAELNDEFVQKVSEYKTVEEFRQGTKDQMLASKEAEAKSQQEYEAVMAVVKGSQIVTEEAAVEEQFNQQLDYYNSMVESYGMKLGDYTAMFGMDEETFKAQIRTSAEDSIKQRLVFQAIAEKENLKVEDADREELAKQYGTDAAGLVTQYGQEAVDENALIPKVLAFLLENAVLVEAPETTAAETAPETTAAETSTGETTEAETTEAATTAAN